MKQDLTNKGYQSPLVVVNSLSKEDVIMVSGTVVKENDYIINPGNWDGIWEVIS